MNVLELDGVCAGYGPLTILDGLSLALAPGEALLLLGANGSGKSTVLKTVAGLTRVTAGSVRIGGADVTRVSADRRAALGLGYVPQTQNVFPTLTVHENLAMGGWLGGHVAARLPAVLDLFPRLAERLNAKAGVLSGGERRMLAIALTMVADPRILLLDEPSSDLSPAMVGEVFSAVARIRAERNIPILIVEQNVTAGLGLASRVVVLARGRCVADLPVADVRQQDLTALFLEGTFHRSP